MARVVRRRADGLPEIRRASFWDSLALRDLCAMAGLLFVWTTGVGLLVELLVRSPLLVATAVAVGLSTLLAVESTRVF